MGHDHDSILQDPLVTVKDLKRMLDSLNPDLPVSVGGASPTQTVVLIDRKRGVLLIDSRKPS